MLPALGLDFAAEDLPRLAKALRQQFELMESLDELDLWAIDPAVTFDPTWHD
jgi:hypothetical protein